VAKLNWAFLGGGGEPLAAKVLDSTSLPTSLAPGETRTVTVRVQNTGTDAWTAGDLVRLGAGPENTVTWVGFSCGGFFGTPGTPAPTCARLFPRGAPPSSASP
jgi:hypothetical protein